MRYPLGIDDFRRLRIDGYSYVDKTRLIIGMLDAGVALFLSRPRRFGKSLTVSTLAELYGGEEAKSLFAGLWAHDNWHFAAMKRPVIWIKLLGIDVGSLGLERALLGAVQTAAHRIDAIASVAGIDTPTLALRMLIRELAGRHRSGRCVVLVDEYDKPIVDFLDDPVRATAHRDALKEFYGVFKSTGYQLELLLLTGVSPFGKVFNFSDLNHLVNLTLDRRALTVVGLTAAELEAHYATDLDATGVPRSMVQAWYNGYSWGGGSLEERVYNPWSVFRFLDSHKILNHWFQTGTPTWLVRLMRDRGQYAPTGTRVREYDLTGFDIEHIDTTAALFQTGYLTVTDVSDGLEEVFTLDYPNLEVRESMETMLLASYLENHTSATRAPVSQIVGALQRDDLDAVITELNVPLADVPYDMWQRGDEGIFHAIVHLTFRLVGVRVRSEVHTHRGRCDALVDTDSQIYAFEFKRDRPVAEALAQVAERGYLEPYAASAKTSIAVGVRFDSETRQIGGWEASIVE